MVPVGGTFLAREIPLKKKRSLIHIIITITYKLQPEIRDQKRFPLRQF